MYDSNDGMVAFTLKIKIKLGLLSPSINHLGFYKTSAALKKLFQRVLNHIQ